MDVQVPRVVCRPPAQKAGINMLNVERVMFADGRGTNVCMAVRGIIIKESQRSYFCAYNNHQEIHGTMGLAYSCTTQMSHWRCRDEILSFLTRLE